MPTPPHSPEVHGYLLAGGQSSRMGSDKALLQLGGRSLLDRALDRLRPLCADLTLLGRAHPNFRHLPDAVPLIGPVGGLTAALRDLETRHDAWALILPVDVPLLPPGLLHALLDHWLSGAFAPVHIPIFGDIPQPVIVLLHCTALPAFEQALVSGEHRLRLVLESAAQPAQLHPTQLSVSENQVLADGIPLPWQPTADELRLAPLWFHNCNTPADLILLEEAIAASPSY